MWGLRSPSHVWVEVKGQMGFWGKAAPWQKGRGRGSDAKHQVPGGPHSSPSLPAQLGGGGMSAPRCVPHTLLSLEIHSFNRSLQGRSRGSHVPLALACAAHTGWPAQGHRRFRKPPGGSAGREGRGEAKPSPGPLGRGAAPGPRVELSQWAGKGLGPAYM